MRIFSLSASLYLDPMKLLDQHRRWKHLRESAAKDEARGRLRESAARHLPGVTFWVYGSLAQDGRFSEHSDVDIAVARIPEGMTLEYAQSLLSADVGREVDICLLDRTRLRDRILAEGEKWTP